MKIVISELIWPIGVEVLEQKGWTVVYDPELVRDREKLASEIKTADALIVRNQTKVDQELLAEAEQLRVVGRLGVGLDNLDLDAIADRNAVAVFAKNANATSVAEYVVSAMIASSRSLEKASMDVKNGNWDRRKHTGGELSGKTLGLIGVGEIGHRVAVRARHLGLKVIGHDPFVGPFDFPIMESGIEL
ncbi:MAG TPA: NAD(P)-dependent oxidoreductase, partial [Bacillales bacterium]